MNSSTRKVLGATLDVQVLVDNKRALGATRQVLVVVGPPWGILRGSKPKLEVWHEMLTRW